MKTIVELREELCAWRKEREGVLRGVPIRLQAQAVLFLDEHTLRKASKKLGVARGTLDGWRKSPKVKEVVEHLRKTDGCTEPPRERPIRSRSIQFVELENMLNIPTLSATPSRTVTLKRPDGISLRIDGEIDGLFVQGLVQAFCQVREVTPCSR